mmetsp:Transcript_21142/g.59439  ORF Transcript_21142/g.59439 Transcript_21142/m.59439 type:complete len:238 (+) Transcript_21142:399-1112(+)
MFSGVSASSISSNSRGFKFPIILTSSGLTSRNFAPIFLRASSLMPAVSLAAPASALPISCVFLPLNRSAAFCRCSLPTVWTASAILRGAADLPTTCTALSRPTVLDVSWTAFAILSGWLTVATIFAGSWSFPASLWRSPGHRISAAARCGAAASSSGSIDSRRSAGFGRAAGDAPRRSAAAAAQDAAVRMLPPRAPPLWPAAGEGGARQVARVPRAPTAHRQPGLAGTDCDPWAEAA